jgi:RHS repeat-associated protein
MCIYTASGSLKEHLQSHGEGDERLHSYRQVAGGALSLAQAPDGYLRGQLSVQRASSKAKASDANVNQLKQGDKQSNQQPRLLDDFGQVVAQHLPDHGDKVSWFDEAGRLVRQESADGSELQFSFDAAARLQSRQHKASGASQPQVLATLRYEGALLQGVDDPEQSTVYEHDALGRKVSETVTLAGLKDQPQTTRTVYDGQSGLVKERVLFDGRVMRIKRSGAMQGATAQLIMLQTARVASIGGWAEKTLPPSMASTVAGWLPKQLVASEIEVDALDGLKGYVSGNGIKTSREHDAAGRLTKVHAQGVLSLGYAYSVGPRVRSLLTQWQGQEANKADYGYWGFGELKGNDATQGPQQNPPLGQPRVIKTAAVQVTNTMNTTSTTSTAQRDKLGRTVQDNQYRYSYTASHQISTISDLKGGQLASYAYNSRGERVSKVVHAGKQVGQQTYYLWQDSRVVAELDGQGQITSQYLYLSEGQQASPLAKLEGSEKVLHIHADQRGVPQAMTDEQRRVVWRGSMNAWGLWKTASQGASSSAVGSANEATLNLRLPGQYFDEESGLHDNVHRTYDPRTGRYLQPDPLGYPDGPDAYLYAQGDPINKIDPLGLYTVYWGGAGLDGPYIDDQLTELRSTGMINVRRGYGSGGSPPYGMILGANAVINLRSYPPQYGYLTPRGPYAPRPRTQKFTCDEQTNYIGYSYGGLLAAQTEIHYANQGNVIDNMILIGAPIDRSFLDLLNSNVNINNVVVINLTHYGDPIFAGMSDLDLLAAIPNLVSDVGTDRGHFYYSQMNPAGRSRRAQLAATLWSEGLR